MRTNTQALPVETWETEPKLKLLARNGDKTAANRSTPKVSAPPAVLRQQRRELQVLGWEARVGRLVVLSRSQS